MLHRFSNKQHIHKPTKSKHLIVGPESSLAGEGSGRSRSTGGGSHGGVGGGQFEGVAIGGESNQQLLGGDTVALPVVHGIVLRKTESYQIHILILTLRLGQRCFQVWV